MAQQRWWRRPWIFPLAAVVVVFLAFSLPPYLSLDPTQTRIPQSTALGAAHYWILVPHVVFGGIALSTAVFQIWPWFRNRHPIAHRRMGRLYVFAGVIPAGLAALTVGAFTPYGPATKASDVLLAILWLTVTIQGWRLARRRRFADHRRWMIRSFALTASIITNRIWGTLLAVSLYPQLDTTFHGDETLFAWVVSGFAAWLGWTIPFLAAEFWLDRDRTPHHPRRPTVSPTPAETPAIR
ncbi:hypothetical protein Ari01nite_43030 [Paractinoplanes rishiriensis]|uniref:Uncharacterized protein n=2 Tax=Paractinoplanes rishiriensis TaxID=1050105 RepID=A0A919JY14_9ACTN|nr:hypothetical protein Ari01nite_43030 [Actinoplanes rishiriensis]